MTILHILKESRSPIALEVIQKEAQKPGQEIIVLLIQEATAQPPVLNHSLKAYILKEDLEERGLSSPPEHKYTCIDYQGMVNLIYQADKVVTW